MSILTIMKQWYLVVFYAALLKGDAVTLATKNDFNNAKRGSGFYMDKTVKKVNGILSVGKNCKVLKDSKDADNFYEYNYIGDIDKQHGLKTIQKEFYNGDQYLLINTKNNCKISYLCGKPAVFDSLLVCSNESETTDKKVFVEIWVMRGNSVVKLKTINLSHDKDPVEVRLSKQHKLIIKDYSNRFWELNYAL